MIKPNTQIITNQQQLNIDINNTTYSTVIKGFTEEQVHWGDYEIGDSKSLQHSRYPKLGKFHP